ncbi:thiamine pyrophosphate-dependent enzyme [Saccharicrinis sp. FJH62]|uniref:alpha-ketoacid dehydrogenase subunit alpha/beta n=1 Tax=Saccharicrinis sp. FJH62 TaxID=3344657 RepID=UPI0035D4EA7C
MALKSNIAPLGNMEELSFEDFKKEVLNDYKLGWVSRNLSITGRMEVLTGKAFFGIFGDGKEVAQIAMAKTFKNGDWRSGYYRDQTFMLATGMLTPEEFFSQLYGDTDINRNPSTGGRGMNNHFGSRIIDADGSWKNQTKQTNSSADVSCTAGQMPRLVGLAQASKLYRNNPDLSHLQSMSKNGNEVAFGTIGDASTSEGQFWESINAAGVLQIPMAISIWDDGYGISVPRSVQTTKDSISEALKGFEKESGTNGLKIYKVKGWDYPELIKIYQKGIQLCRKTHTPVLFHVNELTQPLGHSSSGSHERYKSQEQLNWEKEHDCLVKMKEWILENNLALEEDLDKLESEAKKEVRDARKKAWDAYRKEFDTYYKELRAIVTGKTCTCDIVNKGKIDKVLEELDAVQFPVKEHLLSAAKTILWHTCRTCELKGSLRDQLNVWLKQKRKENYENYSKHLYDEPWPKLVGESVPPGITNAAIQVNGNEVIRRNFDALLANDPRILVFGEDSGKLGDVNQGLAGLQDKFGEMRVGDTGIRETTIIGQGIGLALRGLRPIAEVQYLDYLIYAIQTMSDDLASLSWRTAGGQKAPLIVRTRGHRLEGVWHSGSPMSLLINSLRGFYICVPRNMTQAAGFYNTLLDHDNPALVIEPLNAYNLKEYLPDNLGKFKVPLGKPEILQEGEDITLVTYGSCVRIAQEAIERLKSFDISVELIDVQTLLPFDVEHVIAESIKKTNRVLFFDEDVPGGATGFMMQQVLEVQKAFEYLDSAPKTLTGRDHRPAYSTDGDYFSNPNADDVFEYVYDIMNEAKPDKYPGWT